MSLSLNCSECKRDLCGPHAPTCSRRHQQFCAHSREVKPYGGGWLHRMEERGVPWENCDMPHPVTNGPIKPTHKVGVSVLLTNNEGKLLLGRRTGTTASGMLSTPGGRLEIEEDFISCACREFKEETGANLCSPFVEVIGFKKHFRFGDHYIMFYVHAMQYEGEIGNPEPDKCAGWEWYNFSEIKSEECTEPADILDVVFRRVLKPHFTHRPLYGYPIPYVGDKSK